MLRCYPVFLEPLRHFAHHYNLTLPAWLNWEKEITNSQLDCLWTYLMKQYRDASIGYRAGGFLQPVCWPGLTGSLVQCDSFKAAVHFLLEAQGYLASGSFLEITESDEEITLVVRWPGLSPPVQYQMEEYVVRCLLLLACWLRNPNQWIERVRLRRPSSAGHCSGGYRFLRYSLGPSGKLEFADEPPAIVIHRQTFEARLKRDPFPLIVTPKSSAINDRHEQVIEKVRRYIEAGLKNAAVYRKEVASSLCMSERTLQRSLRAAGTSYGEILNRIRMRKARELLLNSSNGMLDIANALGFSDPASFFRFFKRIEGVTPSHYRQTFGRTPSKLHGDPGRR